MYLLIIIPLYNLNSVLDEQVLLLDRNADGIVTSDEEKSWTEEDHRVSRMWAADGGRNVFGYLVSPIFATVYTCLIYMVLYVSNWLFHKVKSQ